MKSRLEWKVGLFVGLGLVLLAGLMLEFSKGVRFFRGPQYTILLRSANVGGLKPHATVLMSGVQVGSISDIKLAPDGKTVAITLRIDGQYVIHKDARFAIETSGFLGDQYVAIVPTKNEGPKFENGEEAEAEPPLNLQEVARSAVGFVQRIDETARRLNEAIADVRRLVLNERTLTNFAAAVANLRVFSEEARTTLDDIKALVATNSPLLAHSGSNLVVFSEQLNRLADDLNGVVDTNRTDLRTAVKNIESSTEVLKTLVDEVQAGKGLAGALIRNEQIATNVAEITSNLSITSSNLNRLGLWGILWQHKPRKTNAPASAQPLTPPKNPLE